MEGAEAGELEPLARKPRDAVAGFSSTKSPGSQISNLRSQSSMPPLPQQRDRRRPHWLLRRADQAGVAVLIGVGLASTLGWWLSQGGLQDRLVELEQAPEQTAAFQVDINEADWPELAHLPDIGKVRAMRIVESRRTGGPFLDHDDLRRVPGIGPRTLEAMRPYLRPMPGGRNMAAR